MEELYKEVYFNQYCRNCEYEKQAEADDPCHDCLNEAVNAYSHKPVNWKEKR